MRTSTRLIATLLSALGLSGAAQADPIVSVLWQSTGTAEVSVLPGATVTADFYVTLPAGDQLDGYSLSIGWDSGELSYVGFSLLNAPPPPWDPPIIGPPDDPCLGVGTCESALQAISSTPVYGPTTFYIGSISFEANPTDIGGPIDVWAFDTGTIGPDYMAIGASQYTNVTFNGASVDLIPEPATASLLMLALAALAASARRRKVGL